MSSSLPTLINTVRPSGQQCLAFYNEFPSRAVGLNVIHSQLQFELGGADVCVCVGGAVGTMFVCFQMTEDKANRHETPLMKMSKCKQRNGRRQKRRIYRVLLLCARGRVLSQLPARTKCQNKCNRQRESFCGHGLSGETVYYSIKSHKAHVTQLLY